MNNDRIDGSSAESQLPKRIVGCGDPILYDGIVTESEKRHGEAVLIGTKHHGEALSHGIVQEQFPSEESYCHGYEALSDSGERGQTQKAYGKEKENGKYQSQQAFLSPQLANEEP